MHISPPTTTPPRGRELSQLRLLFTLSAVVDWLRLLCSNQLIHHACDLAPILPPDHPSLFHCCAVTAGEPPATLRTNATATSYVRPHYSCPHFKRHTWLMWCVQWFSISADTISNKRLQSHTPESHLPAFFSSPPYRCINKHSCSNVILL